MFKIHNDKVYFVAETPDINKVIEIFLPKDDHGTIMDSHEIRVDLCRAVIHMEKKGIRVLKVRNIEDTNKANIDVWHMPEYQEAAESPTSDVVDACIESNFDSGATFNLPCKANRKTREVFALALMTMTRSAMQRLKSVDGTIRLTTSPTLWRKTMLTVRWMSSTASSRKASIGKRTTASHSRTLSMNSAGLS